VTADNKVVNSATRRTVPCHTERHSRQLIRKPNQPHSFVKYTKNISLQLPSGYELTAGIGAENIYLYYELVKVSVAATLHWVK